eukprot:TRINITY_DN1607_c0_g1_i1.p1 TRINITY_DN1607_c0_g1~~TRINITY_DN1607_c0_g1_i1.p1  ORF type:complete len:615 (+),score=131.03 TRINITY_DN1607_c0_g1_i1:202-2046(+)
MGFLNFFGGGAATIDTTFEENRKHYKMLVKNGKELEGALAKHEKVMLEVGPSYLTLGQSMKTFYAEDPDYHQKADKFSLTAGAISSAHEDWQKRINEVRESIRDYTSKLKKLSGRISERDDLLDRMDKATHEHGEILRKDHVDDKKAKKAEEKYDQAKLAYDTANDALNLELGNLWKFRGKEFDIEYKKIVSAHLDMTEDIHCASELLKPPATSSTSTTSVSTPSLSATSPVSATSPSPSVSVTSSLSVSDPTPAANDASSSSFYTSPPISPRSGQNQSAPTLQPSFPSSRSPPPPPPGTRADSSAAYPPPAVDRGRGGSRPPIPSTPSYASQPAPQAYPHTAPTPSYPKPSSSQAYPRPPAAQSHRQLPPPGVPRAPPAGAQPRPARPPKPRSGSNLYPSATPPNPNYTTPPVPRVDLANDARYQVIQTLVTEETTYQRHLTNLASTRQLAFYTVQPGDLGAIFFGLDEIQRHQAPIQQTITSLQTSFASTAQNIAPYLQPLLDILPSYQSYFANYTTAVETVRNCNQFVPKFKEITDRYQYQNNGSSLEVGLLLPMQRMASYCTALQKLVAETDSEAADYNALYNIFDKFVDVMMAVEEATREAAVNAGWSV